MTRKNAENSRVAAEFTQEVDSQSERRQPDRRPDDGLDE